MNHFLKITLLLLTFIISSQVHAFGFAVKGVVKDSIGEPESFATVRVFTLTDTVKPVTAGVAGEDGAFNVAVKQAGKYRVNILAFGKADANREVDLTAEKPVADLGNIVMSNVASLLQEVVVTAQKPLVSKEIDRIGYDVQADAEAKTSQLDEILKKVPLVSVDPDGTIKVKGSTDFKIYKNGRPNNSFTRNAKDIFKSLPASMIKKIEVITDPGAREDAEGTSAILNIVTVENTTIKGAMGTVGLNYRTPNNIPNPNVWLSAQIDKVNLSFYGGLSMMSRKDMESRSETFSKYEDSGNEMKTTSTSSGKGMLSYFGVEGSYELDSLNLFTAEFGGYFYKLKTDSFGRTVMTDAQGTPIYSYNSVMTMDPSRYFDFNGGFNYQRSTRKKGENITFSYLLSTTNQKQHSISDYEDPVNMPVDYTGMENEFTLDYTEHTFQVDWARPINEYNKFDIGSKYIHRINHSINDIDYFSDRKEHSDFKHLTQVLALYFDYRLNYAKWGARAGVRYEYSHLSAKYKDGSNPDFGSDLNDIVPNAAISYNVNDANSLKLSYSTRINRPGISQLNPAVVESPSSISSGNPDLGSSLYHSLSFNYNFISRKFNLDLNASYSFTNNSVISIEDVIENDILKSTYANAGHNKSFYASAWMQWAMTQKTSVMVNLSTSFGKEENRSLMLKSCGWSYNGFVRVRQKLPFDIDLALYGSVYQGRPSLYSKTTRSFKNNIYYGLDLQKSFLKEKRLTVRFGISNPFGMKNRLYESIPRNAGYTGYDRSWNLHNANMLNIGVSYRFGSFNAQVKKTAGSISNDDVENRRN